MKISPCPFCGSSDVKLVIYDGSVLPWYFRCECCGTKGPVATNREAAIAFWNTRTGTVYNGKTAEEWYRLYVEALSRENSLRYGLVPPVAPCPPPSEAP
jgi:Lar family restriction alleviation protein